MGRKKKFRKVFEKKSKSLMDNTGLIIAGIDCTSITSETQVRDKALEDIGQFNNDSCGSVGDIPFYWMANQRAANSMMCRHNDNIAVTEGSVNNCLYTLHYKGFRGGENFNCEDYIEKVTNYILSDKLWSNLLEWCKKDDSNDTYEQITTTEYLNKVTNTEYSFTNILDTVDESLCTDSAVSSFGDNVVSYIHDSTKKLKRNFANDEDHYPEAAGNYMEQFEFLRFYYLGDESEFGTTEAYFLEAFGNQPDREDKEFFVYDLYADDKQSNDNCETFSALGSEWHTTDTSVGNQANCRLAIDNIEKCFNYSIDGALFRRYCPWTCMEQIRNELAKQEQDYNTSYESAAIWYFVAYRCPYLCLNGQDCDNECNGDDCSGEIVTTTELPDTPPPDTPPPDCEGPDCVEQGDEDDNNNNNDHIIAIAAGATAATVAVAAIAGSGFWYFKPSSSGMVEDTVQSWNLELDELEVERERLIEVNHKDYVK